jgi:phosphohistidine swiveling domain-containing protein
MSNQKLVLPLELIPDSSVCFGTKAVNLARMIRRRLPVPSGFCIAVQAYQDHLRINNLIPDIQTAITLIRTVSGNEKQAKLNEMRKRIIDAPLLEELQSEIKEHYLTLGTKRIAVRSSGTAEDLPGHSFAGLYSTFLGECNNEKCLEQVKCCWASLWTERVFEYREKNRFDHINAGMSVIIQSLIRADISGVVFTADPVTGSNDHIILEAVKGLGENLVSGRTVPDRFVLSRYGLKVIENTIVPETNVSKQVVVSEKLAKRVSRIALKIEQLMDSPQDIEWAIANGKVWFLQSRPVTTLQDQKSWEKHQVWTNINIGEALPDAVPPMTAEALKRFFYKLVTFLNIGNVSVGDNPILGQIAGRPYFNLNTLSAIVRNIPVIGRMRISDIFGGLKDEDIPKPEYLPKIKTNRLKMLFRLPGMLIWILRSQPSKSRTKLSEHIARTDNLQQLNLKLLSDEELIGQMFYGINDVFTRAQNLGGALTCMMYFSALYQICRKWLKESEGSIASHLLTGLGDIESAQAGLEIWRLSQLLAENDALKLLVVSNKSWYEIRPEIEKTDRNFIARWERLMFRHGHHCRGEFDFSKSRWDERPDFILGMMRSYINAQDTMNPEREFGHRIQERKQFTEECRKKLHNPVKRIIFNYFLKQAQLGACLRENLRDDVNRRIGISRKILLELGIRLTRRGLLAETNDIFFLSAEELTAIHKGTQSFDIRNTITDRKAEFERNKLLVPPPVVVGRFDPVKHKPESIQTDARVLTGIGVSPGIATGQARVIMSYSMEERVLPGEILIAPFTDPGWTPYFLPAAGIVVDIGGLLSHGSIVAREYGKPAVVNVGPATKIIKTGQMIQVDGNLGQVRILFDA